MNRRVMTAPAEVAASLSDGAGPLEVDHLLTPVANERRPPTALAGVAVGTLIAVCDSGELLVDFPDNRFRKPVPARSTIPVCRPDVGREVALLFQNGDARKPIVVGLLRQPSGAPAQGPEVTLDGERLVLTAQKELVLRCGEATITLTRAGKVLIRGAYLLSRSSGVNRIKGGSVQIN